MNELDLIVSRLGGFQFLTAAVATAALDSRTEADVALTSGGNTKPRAAATFAALPPAYEAAFVQDITIARGVTSTSLRIGSSSIYDARYLYVSGTANYTTVNRYGCMYISSGGTASATTVNYYGSMWVAGGGTANSTTVNTSGYMLVSGGGTANSTTVNSSGDMRVSSGGTATYTIVNRSGAYGVFGGGTANYTIVRAGHMGVYGGGMANGTTINSSGDMNVEHDGTANSTTVNSGGVMRLGYLTYGGTATSTTVNSGGNMTIGHGGTANSTTVNSGGSMILSSGAVLGGMNTLGGTVNANGAVTVNWATLNFAVNQRTTADSYIIDNIAVISGANYSITVKSDQAAGSYQLAAGAADFNQSVTVKNTAGATLGSLTVGGTLVSGGYTYTLAVTDSVLTLGVANTPITAAAKSDVDGNGVSDVLFQWTGGDYQLGYWMNGTFEWRGAGRPHLADWEVLGAYDMDANGNADAVLVGNVTVGGVKGAYIGYYLDGVDTDANWRNIGYLNNADSIEWDNACGNLTGNDGKNSIVWHAPELGALGAWTDGTDNWVSLGGGFDADWKLIGCGDFAGDGADSAVMSYGNGLKYYAIGLDGSAVELGASDSGWSIAAIGDFAGDGIDDIVAFHAETGLVARWEDGRAANWSKLGQLDARDWFVVGAGDYNGDAKDDLLVRQYSTGMLGYYSAADMSQWRELGRGVSTDWAVIA